MIVPGVLGIVMGILLMVGLRDVPSSLGLPEHVVETQDCFNEEAFDANEFIKSKKSNYYIT